MNSGTAKHITGRSILLIVDCTEALDIYAIDR